MPIWLNLFSLTGGADIKLLTQSSFTQDNCTPGSLEITC